MKKILLLSLVLTILCWGFASAANVSTSVKGSDQTKVVKATPKKVPVSLREGAPKIQAISPNSTTNVGEKATAPIMKSTDKSITATKSPVTLKNEQPRTDKEPAQFVTPST
ncbi:MAG TPA: hypothetical protein DCZ43_03840, partial [candidate division Zixibacteria bacterium]|nr:hypothetical protein [candidate division Zixibacteria bacterium]